MKERLSDEKENMIADFLRSNEMSWDKVINSMYHYLYVKALKILRDNKDAWIFVNGNAFIIHVVSVDFRKCGLDSKEDWSIMFRDTFSTIVNEKKKDGFFIANEEKLVSYINDYKIIA